MKQIIRNIKNAVWYDNVEIEVRDATSNSEEAVTSRQLTQLSRTALDPRKYPTLFAMLWKRITHYKHHRHIQKALYVLIYLVRLKPPSVAVQRRLIDDIMSPSQLADLRLLANLRERANFPILHIIRKQASDLLEWLLYMRKVDISQLQPLDIGDGFDLPAPRDDNSNQSSLHPYQQQQQPQPQPQQQIVMPQQQQAVIQPSHDDLFDLLQDSFAQPVPNTGPQLGGYTFTTYPDQGVQYDPFNDLGNNNNDHNHTGHGTKRCAFCDYENDINAEICVNCSCELHAFDDIVWDQDDNNDNQHDHVHNNGEACSKCGTINPIGSNFCSGCGCDLGGALPESMPLQIQCPQCQGYNPEGTVVCGHCGYGLCGGHDHTGHGQGGQVLKQPKEVRGWACAWCSLLNELTRSSCIQCQRDQHASQRANQVKFQMSSIKHKNKNHETGKETLLWQCTCYCVNEHGAHYCRICGLDYSHHIDSNTDTVEVHTTHSVRNVDAYNQKAIDKSRKEQQLEKGIDGARVQIPGMVTSSQQQSSSSSQQQAQPQQGSLASVMISSPVQQQPQPQQQQQQQQTSRRGMNSSNTSSVSSPTVLSPVPRQSSQSISVAPVQQQQQQYTPQPVQHAPAPSVSSNQNDFFIDPFASIVVEQSVPLPQKAVSTSVYDDDPFGDLVKQNNQSNQPQSAFELAPMQQQQQQQYTAQYQQQQPQQYGGSQYQQQQQYSSVSAMSVNPQQVSSPTYTDPFAVGAMSPNAPSTIYNNTTSTHSQRSSIVQQQQQQQSQQYNIDPFASDDLFTNASFTQQQPQQPQLQQQQSYTPQQQHNTLPSQQRTSRRGQSSSAATLPAAAASPTIPQNNTAIRNNNSNNNDPWDDQDPFTFGDSPTLGNTTINTNNSIQEQKRIAAEQLTQQNLLLQQQQAELALKLQKEQLEEAQRLHAQQIALMQQQHQAKLEQLRIEQEELYIAEQARLEHERQREQERIKQRQVLDNALNSAPTSTTGGQQHGNNINSQTSLESFDIFGSLVGNTTTTTTTNSNNNNNYDLFGTLDMKPAPEQPPPGVVRQPRASAPAVASSYTTATHNTQQHVTSPPGLNILALTVNTNKTSGGTTQQAQIHSPVPQEQQFDMFTHDITATTTTTTYPQQPQSPQMEQIKPYSASTLSDSLTSSQTSQQQQQNTAALTTASTSTGPGIVGPTTTTTERPGSTVGGASQFLQELHSSQQTYRQKVRSEIIATEKSYIDTLITLKECFIEPLKQSAVSMRLPDHVVPTLLTDLEPIIIIHQNLIIALEKTDSITTQGIAQTFIQFTPMFHPYKQYCANYAKTLESIETTMKEHKQFASFVKKHTASSRFANRPLSSFYIAPVQRLPRYVLLLRELKTAYEKTIKKSQELMEKPDSMFADGSTVDQELMALSMDPAQLAIMNNDIAIIQQAIDVVNTYAVTVNTYQKEIEGLNVLTDIYNKLGRKHANLQFGHASLVNVKLRNRTLIRDTILVQEKNNKQRPIRLILCNDCVFIINPDSTEFKGGINLLHLVFKPSTSSIALFNERWGLPFDHLPQPTSGTSWFIDFCCSDKCFEIPQGTRIKKQLDELDQQIQNEKQMIMHPTFGRGLVRPDSAGMNHKNTSQNDHELQYQQLTQLYQDIDNETHVSPEVMRELAIDKTHLSTFFRIIFPSSSAMDEYVSLLTQYMNETYSKSTVSYVSDLMMQRRAGTVTSAAPSIAPSSTHTNNPFSPTASSTSSSLPPLLGGPRGSISTQQSANTTTATATTSGGGASGTSALPPLLAGTAALRPTSPLVPTPEQAVVVSSSSSSTAPSPPVPPSVHSVPAPAPIITQQQPSLPPTPFVPAAVQAPPPVGVSSTTASSPMPFVPASTQAPPPAGAPSGGGNNTTTTATSGDDIQHQPKITQPIARRASTAQNPLSYNPAAAPQFSFKPAPGSTTTTSTTAASSLSVPSTLSPAPPTTTTAQPTAPVPPPIPLAALPPGGPTPKIGETKNLLAPVPKAAVTLPTTTPSVNPFAPPTQHRKSIFGEAPPMLGQQPR